jgi:hypothetical protein
LKSSKHKSIKEYESIEPPLLRIVPLPNFTISDIESNFEEKKGTNFTRIILNILLLFVPRWYKITKKEDMIKLSPFSRMARVFEEHNIYNIYENPAIEAVINFYWKKARSYYFYSLFFRFFVFAICFGLISWAYLNHTTIVNQQFLFTLIVLFYYLALYLLFTEVFQLYYHRIKYIFNLCNIVDVISVIFAVTIMSIMVKNFQFSDGFGSVTEISTGFTVWITFSITFIWLELVRKFQLFLNHHIKLFN